MIELTEDQIKKLKCIELEILKEFIRVCNELNLQYFVVDGTLLGAVRHNGFIPWDDDIDVGMMRDDYEKLLKEGYQLFSSDYFLQNTDTDPDVPFSFSKIRKVNTLFVESSDSTFNINHGIYIDVFPLDYYPESNIKRKLVNFFNDVLSKRINYELGISRKNNAISRIAGVISKVIFPNYRKAVKAKNKLYKRVGKTSKLFLRNYASAWGLREVAPVNEFDKCVSLSFEGIMVNAPALYHDYLTRVYGDYMQLPPEENRQPHHFVDQISFNL